MSFAAHAKCMGRATWMALPLSQLCEGSTLLLDLVAGQPQLTASCVFLGAKVLFRLVGGVALLVLLLSPATT
jgi:hypothetical protein